MNPIPTPPVDPAAPALNGPYDQVNNGSCACHGSPVNGYGRCQPLNDATRAATALDKP